ncbi:MAG: cobalt-precorrin-5B (C(1))-methyltransferase CbiD [Leptolyngbya sp.]|nr:cobalt-precorrin-5B (C(1))-methyltransferase CbiD [Leptolyngbya sp.]
MTTSSATPRPGYTLPVFACASAVAAYHRLRAPHWSAPTVTVDLVRPPETATIPLEQVAPLPDGSVLAISRSDPGDNLDLTRHTPIWAVVRWGDRHQCDPLHVTGGEGIGIQLTPGDAQGTQGGEAPAPQPAIYRYAHQVFRANLLPLIPPDRTLHVTIILPEGRTLATRTSNAAFGVVEGLSLLGTTGISQPLSAPGQLETFRADLRTKAAAGTPLVFCVGENGLDKARHLGIDPTQQVKTANWIGPLLVEAALVGVPSVLLLGYHGKLIKLAGGIFHTHHHVADGRQEILTAIAAVEGLPTAACQALLQASTVEAGLTYLRDHDAAQGTSWATQVYQTLVERIDQRAAAYVGHHSDRPLTIGTALFDRQRTLFAVSGQGRSLLTQVGD